MQPINQARGTLVCEQFAAGTGVFRTLAPLFVGYVRESRIGAACLAIA
jgi:hypothetical protein